MLRRPVPANSKGVATCCGMGLIQVIVLSMCVGQTFFLGYLFMNHNIFKESIYDLSEVSNTIIKTGTSVAGTITDRNYIKTVGDQLKSLTKIHIQYTKFPVKVIDVDHDEHIPLESRSVVKALIGRLVDVDFPDLRYRSKDAIRRQYSRMFEELPENGFIPELKNPCWQLKSDGETMHCLPYAYVLGQPKSGTSDLYERMKGHQDIMYV